MRYAVLKTLLVLAGFTLAACTTLDKYASARFYELYAVKGLSACDFKPKFNDCATTYDFDVKISDGNDKVALAKYINHRNHVSYFGFTRENYPAQVQPLRDFLLWARQDNAADKQIVIKRPAGNTAGYLYQNREVEYKFSLTHTRGDIAMLVIQVGDRGGYYGLTVDEVTRILATLDEWYQQRLIAKRLT